MKKNQNNIVDLIEFQLNFRKELEQINSLLPVIMKKKQSWDQWLVNRLAEYPWGTFYFLSMIALAFFIAGVNLDARPWLLGIGIIAVLFHPWYAEVFKSIWD